jgi:hypothetical protein
VTPQPEDEDLSEIAKVRVRLHRLNDMVHKHELQLHESGIRYELLDRQVKTLTAQTATREQLDAAVLSLGSSLTAAVNLMTLQIKNIADDITPIKKGIYWVVGLVLGTVVLAGLAFLFRRPGV